MTATVEPDPHGFTATCDACSFTRPGIGRSVAQHLADLHNAGECPGARPPGNPAPVQRPRGRRLGD